MSSQGLVPDFQKQIAATAQLRSTNTRSHPDEFQDAHRTASPRLRFAESSRDRPPRSWFVIRHRCHFVKQRLCLATQTPTESAWLRGGRPQSRRADLSALQRLLKSGTVGTVLPNGGRTRHYVSCNDSLGRWRVRARRKHPSATASDVRRAKLAAIGRTRI